MKKPKSNAAAQYAANTKRVRAASAALARLLTEHRKKAEAKPFDWGFAGDLEYVARQLEEVVKFLNSGTPRREERS